MLAVKLNLFKLLVKLVSILSRTKALELTQTQQSYVNTRSGMNVLNQHKTNPFSPRFSLTFKIYKESQRTMVSGAKL